MRLTLLSFYSGHVHRGVEIYAQALVKGLIHHQVDFITTADLPTKLPSYHGNENIILRRLYLDPISWHIYQATKLILDQLKLHPPDIIYPLNNGWQSILSKLFCLKHKKTKLVLAGHSGPGWDDRVNLRLNPDLFIAFSSSQAQWARGVNKKINLATIPHGVDTDQFKPGVSPIKLPLQKPIFVTTSALSSPGGAGETAKNIDLTIKAIAQLPRGSLLLLGSGPDSDRIDNLANKLLGPNRYSRFSVSHNIIQQYYQTADVFTLASSASEAFGLSYLEALACNLPVVTVNDYLRREIVGLAGIFIDDPHNLEGYTRGLDQALKHQWGNQPRHQATKFSWDKIIPQYVKAFTHLAAS